LIRRSPEILYEDDCIIVCVKPAGVPSEGGKGRTADMVSLLKNHVAGKTGGHLPYIACVHRLDVPVAGLMVYAKTREAAASLSDQIKKHSFEKEYVCAVTGALETEASATFMERRDMLFFDHKTNFSGVVKEGIKVFDKAEIKEAKLLYRIIAKDGDRALVRVKLLTGRHHQIRVQMAEIFHGIEGDTKYNPDERETDSHKLKLECCHLGFISPSNGKKLNFDREPSFD